MNTKNILFMFEISSIYIPNYFCHREVNHVDI